MRGQKPEQRADCGRACLTRLWVFFYDLLREIEVFTKENDRGMLSGICAGFRYCLGWCLQMDLDVLRGDVQKFTAFLVLIPFWKSSVSKRKKKVLRGYRGDFPMSPLKKWNINTSRLQNPPKSKIRAGGHFFHVYEIKIIQNLIFLFKPNSFVKNS